MRTPSGVSYIHADHPSASLRAGLGSTAVISGAQSGNIRYYPYGTTRSGAVATAYKFTGQRLDDSTGLYFYGARYYDAALGRFIQADTIVPQPGNPQALNRYSYVLNNPLRYVDPTGRRYEQSAGYVFDPNYWRDLLLWFVREANRNARLPEVQIMRLNNVVGNLGPPGAGSKALAGGMFYQLVRDSGPWDFKDETEDKRKGG
ncbi:MAG: RHS repeat-associated core domain-containing protein [Chloroflexi bacterium]|nr:RHS repeat-associated core domain-containing protein [Chloroflexota bacterium]